jgi:hypothetical protein
MGFLGKLFGIKQGQAYVDAGLALTLKFCREWKLPGWKDGLPEYTTEELKAIELEASRFQAIADNQMGGSAVFHPEIEGDLRRSLAGTALGDYASDQAMGVCSWLDDEEEEDRPDWRPVVSTFLKAWASKLDPMTMISLGDFLSRVGQKDAAKEAYKVVLHLPSYAKKLWGPGHEDLVKGNLQLAKEALASLES